MVIQRFTSCTREALHSTAFKLSPGCNITFICLQKTILQRIKSISAKHNFAQAVFTLKNICLQINYHNYSAKIKGKYKDKDWYGICYGLHWAYENNKRDEVVDNIMSTEYNKKNDIESIFLHDFQMGRKVGSLLSKFIEV